MQKRRIAVVGGGIIGAAVAAQLVGGDPANEVTVYEKEDGPARHQTGHNSGVVHAGLYYTPGSLKARLTRRGVTLLKDFCEQNDVRYDECGKLVVAHQPEQRPLLEAIREKALANGVPGVSVVDQAGIAEIEPHSTGIAAIHSPHTAIVDYPMVAQRLLELVQAAGGTIRFGEEVRRVSRRAGEQLVESKSGNEVYDYVIVCSGLRSDRVARESGASRFPIIVPFSGDYYQLVSAKADLVRGLLYPVPDPDYPFLGVHLTRTIDGDVTVGPNAFLSFAREQYGRFGFSLRDSLETATQPAFWRFASQNFGAAIDQLRSVAKSEFVKGAQAFVPELQSADLQRGPRGIRAQAMDRDGTLVDDFVIERLDNTVFIRNAPSPAATSSLAIAEYIVTEVLGDDHLVCPVNEQPN